MTSVTTTHQSQHGPGFFVRALWFVFVGWWLTAFMSAIAWFAMVTIIGLPLGIYLINRIPTFLTLRPRTEHWETTTAGGVSTVTRQRQSAPAWPIRLVWFIFIGSWASALVMAVGWILVVLIVTLPLGLMLYNRVPFVASLVRY